MQCKEILENLCRDHRNKRLHEVSTSTAAGMADLHLYNPYYYQVYIMGRESVALHYTL